MNVPSIHPIWIVVNYKNQNCCLADEDLKLEDRNKTYG